MQPPFVVQLRRHCRSDVAIAVLLGRVNTRGKKQLLDIGLQTDSATDATSTRC
jgi:hypothetical protein